MRRPGPGRPYDPAGARHQRQAAVRLTPEVAADLEAARAVAARVTGEAHPSTATVIAVALSVLARTPPEPG